MENEIMNYEEEEVMDPEVEIEEGESSTGVSTGAAVAIGAGLTALAIGVVKFGKKLWAKHKAKKLKTADDDDLEEVTDDDEEDMDVGE